LIVDGRSYATKLTKEAQRFTKQQWVLGWLMGDDV